MLDNPPNKTTCSQAISCSHTRLTSRAQEMLMLLHGVYILHVYKRTHGIFKNHASYQKSWATTSTACNFYLYTIHIMYVYNSMLFIQQIWKCFLTKPLARATAHGHWMALKQGLAMIGEDPYLLECRPAPPSELKTCIAPFLLFPFSLTFLFFLFFSFLYFFSFLSFLHFPFLFSFLLRTLMIWASTPFLKPPNFFLAKF